MSWDNLDVGANAMFTERFEWGIYSIFDLVKYWGKKLTPLWIASIFFVIFFVLFIIGNKVWKRIKNLRKNMRCPECNARIPLDGGYCPNCGCQRPSIWEELKMVMAKKKNQSNKQATTLISKSPSDSYFLETDQARAISSSQSYLVLDDERYINLPLSGHFTIGNVQQCDLKLIVKNGQDYLIGITHGKTRYFLEILTTSSTIYLNQKPISNAINLNDGDKITLGDVSFSFHSHKPSTAS